MQIKSIYSQFKKLIVLFALLCLYHNSYADNFNNTLAHTKSVKDFGALGNGSSDDTESIQKALDWLALNGGKLVFPKGEYKVTQALTLALTKEAEIDASNATINSTQLISNKCNDGTICPATLSIFGEKKLIGYLSANAKQTKDISISSTEVRKGDLLILQQDQAQQNNYNLIITPINGSGLTIDGGIKTNTLVTLSVLDAEGVTQAYFNSNMVGKSIVFPMQNALSLETASNPRGDMSQLNQTNYNPTILITGYDPVAKQATGLVGNDNNIKSTNIAPGDWGLLELYDPARGYYIKGEFKKVTQVNGNKVSFINTLNDSYAANATNIYRLNRAKIKINGLSFISSLDKIDAALDIHYLDKVELKNITVKQARYNGVQLRQINDINVVNANINGIPICPSCTAYGLLVTSGQNVVIDGGKYDSAKHAISISAMFPTQNVTLKNLSVGEAGIDSHGGVANMKLINVVSHGGLSFSGTNLNIESSILYNRTSGAFNSAISINEERSFKSINILNTQAIATNNNATSTALRINNNFINVSSPGKYGSINIKNSLFKANGTAVVLQAASNLPTVNYDSLSIQNSQLLSDKNIALVIHNNTSELNISQVSIMNNTISSKSNYAIYMIPSLNKSDAFNNVQISGNKLFSTTNGANQPGAKIYNNKSLKFNNNQLNGQPVLQAP